MRTPYFSLKNKANNGKGPRAAVVAGKNVHKTAVRRNFWKRQSSEIMSAYLRDDRDTILILTARINELTKKQFQEELRKAVRGIK